jgi:hypothetical protein
MLDLPNDCLSSSHGKDSDLNSLHNPKDRIREHQEGSALQISFCSQQPLLFFYIPQFLSLAHVS